MRKIQGQLVRFGTLIPLTAVLAMSYATAKTGPLLPPDPWESTMAKTGPLLPPDPWESTMAKTGPLLPPDPWESTIVG